MKKWVTEILAIDPVDGQLKRWMGPFIEAPTQELAQEWCNNNYMGFLRVGDELVAEIPCDDDGGNIKWGEMIDYTKAMLN